MTTLAVTVEHGWERVNIQLQHMIAVMKLCNDMDDVKRTLVPASSRRSRCG
jgi:hypothetical protein